MESHLTLRKSLLVCKGTDGVDDGASAFTLVYGARNVHKPFVLFVSDSMHSNLRILDSVLELLIFTQL